MDTVAVHDLILTIFLGQRIERVRNPRKLLLDESQFQQNVSRYAIGVVVLVAQSNRVQDLLPLVPRVLQLLPDLRPGTLVRVESPATGGNGGE